MATKLPSCFLIQFLEQLLKFLVNFVEICQVSEKLWLFNHKRAYFWLDHFSASLNPAEERDKIKCSELNYEWIEQYICMEREDRIFKNVGV